MLMLRKLFLFLLLPLLLLVILAYAAIPIWVSLIAPNFVSTGPHWQIEHIKVGYPSFTSWHIKSLRASHTLEPHAEKSNQIVLDNIALTYQLQDLLQGKVSNITIAQAAISLTNNNQADSLALQLFHPAGWLAQVPPLSITRFDGTIENFTPAMETIFLSGKLNTDAKSAYVVARLTTDISGVTSDRNNTFYIESTFDHNNHVDATIFNEAQSTAIAKITSQLKNTGSTILWQGKLAVDMGSVPALVANQLPKSLDFSNTQGKLTSNWYLSIPLQGTDSIANILDTASGKHEIQIHAQTKQPWANTLSIDANLTQTLISKAPDTWQINNGSQLFANLNWKHLGISPTTVKNVGLETIELRLKAPSAVIVDKQTDGLAFAGIINATLSSDLVGYQLYSQLKNLRYEYTGRWHGNAYISGSYAFPIESPILQQLPIGIQQVQALAEVEFDLFADRWRLKLAKHSKLSANQVFNHSQQGQWQLFANDRLNLSISEPLTLTYHTTKDQWQWSDLQLSLQPETSTGNANAYSKELGLHLTLPAGANKLSQRVNQGRFQLNAKDTRLVGWPSFNLVGTGVFILSNDSLELAFNGDALPLSQEVKVDIDWQWRTQATTHNNNIGKAVINAFNIPLVTLQGNNSGKWPFLLEKGETNYLGQWQWHTQGIDTKVQSNHEFTLRQATVIHPNYSLTDAKGKVLINKQNRQVTTDYQINSGNMQLQPQLANHPILDVNMALSASSKSNKPLADILQKPDIWQLDRFTGKLMGGQILLTDMKNNQWQVKAINLGMLSKTVYPNIKAQGALSGQLQLDNAWHLQGFQLIADDKAQISLITPLSDDVPSADTLNKVLKEFSSDRLTLLGNGVNAKNKMPITINLQGSSPHFNNGEAINLNLQLEANINQRLQQVQ